ncbi:MAG TPA: formate dehydrogenase accessory sulfurtransferase FdhD [Burkholderiales bacterium]|nr:formate dehydrogenase accessory sulfurtransferase FdhD [Burkholderiales bacterium]
MSFIEELVGPARALPAYVNTKAERHDGSRTEMCDDLVAAETAVAVRYNGAPHAVMMATPAEMEAFAIGFTLTEGVVKKPSEIHAVQVQVLEEGIELDIRIDATRHRALDRKRRILTGSVGCGLCGAQSIAQAIRRSPAVPLTLQLSDAAIRRALSELPEMQAINRATGAAHGAAWFNAQGEIELLCEDVGRHNALDKLIGTMVQSGRAFDRGAVLMTSRASHEIVQKAAAVGIQALVALSAPTSLAITVAAKSRITLVAFARANRYTVYTGAERLTESLTPTS